MKFNDSVLSVLENKFDIPRQDVSLEKTDLDLKYPDVIIIKDAQKLNTREILEYMPTCIECIV